MSSVIFPAQPEQILKGLSKVWTSLGQEEKQQGRPTVLRACAMTLVVATDEPDNGYAASQIIGELMREHPSRGIVLAVSKEAERALEARVLAQCWKPFGKAQQICCEQIEITARPEAWPNIGPTLGGLIAADLPVIFWCRHHAALLKSASPEQTAGLEAVVHLAQKVVIDSYDMPVIDATELISRWHQEGRIVGDLEWTRLTPWREPICHIFDNENRTNGFSQFHTFELEYGDDHPPICAIYMAAWLSGPYNAQVAFRKAANAQSGISRIIMKSPTETIEFFRESPTCATLQSTNGRARKYNFGGATLTSLMTEELSVVAADPSFNAAFPRALALLDHAK